MERTYKLPTGTIIDLLEVKSISKAWETSYDNSDHMFCTKRKGYMTCFLALHKNYTINSEDWDIKRGKVLDEAIKKQIITDFEVLYNDLVTQWKAVKNFELNKNN